MSSNYKAKYENFFDSMLGYFKTRINEKIKGKNMVRYSAYKMDIVGVPINNLDNIAIKGKFKFYQKCDPFFSEKGKDYISKLVTNPTWLEVAILANDMIKITGDKHHVFLEGVRKYRNKAKFNMGS